MSVFPKEPKKIGARITRYERELRKERDKFGYISDEQILAACDALRPAPETGAEINEQL